MAICILVMKKNENPDNWIFSAKGEAGALKALKCYQDPPEGVVPKSENPGIFVADVLIPNCKGNGPKENGKVYSLKNG